MQHTLFAASKYSMERSGSATIVLSPGCQFAGHTWPWWRGGAAWWWWWWWETAQRQSTHAHTHKTEHTGCRWSVGHTSPYLAWNWIACTSRSVSSTLRPIGCRVMGGGVRQEQALGQQQQEEQQQQWQGVESTHAPPMCSIKMGVCQDFTAAAAAAASTAVATPGNCNCMQLVIYARARAHTYI
jgi:hypothetical protein